MAVLNHSWPMLARPRVVRLDWHLAPLIVLAVSYALLFSVRGWDQFVDESDNFLGGYLIAHGQILYRDYFSHHMPLPYYLAAIPSLLGVHDLVGYRVFTSLVILTFWTFIVVRFRTRIAPTILYLFVLMIGVGIWMFLGNLLLGETIEAYCLLTVCLYFYAYPSLDLRPADQLVVASLVFAALMSSLMSVYPFGVLLSYYVYRRASARQVWNIAAFFRTEARFGAMLVAPFVALAIALLASGTLTTFVQDTFVFNQVYYSKYTLAGDPLQIGVLLLRSDYHLVRDTIRLLAWRSVDGFALVANTITFVLLIPRRGLWFALGFAAIAATARGRGESFHDQPYYVLSLFAIAATVALAASVLPLVTLQLRQAVSFRQAVRAVAILMGAGTYMLLAAMIFANVMRNFPWSYQTPEQFAFQQVVQEATGPGDTVWIAPLDFYGYLLVDRMPATKYAFYLPWLADSPAINAAILHDLTESRPPIIIYERDVALVTYQNGHNEILVLDTYGQALRQRLAADYVFADEVDPVLRSVLLRKDLAGELRDRLRSAKANGSVAKTP